MEEMKFMVRVSCMTYNQKDYIINALDGFCTQKTSFDYVCTIIDDASTEGEQHVIKSYFKEHFDLSDRIIFEQEDTADYTLFFARHLINKHCYFVVLLLKQNQYGKVDKDVYVDRWVSASKYTALCEGDDYWIDNNKLQKQVDYLESHPEVYSVHTAFENYYQERGISVERHWPKYEDNVQFAWDIVAGVTDIQTCTYMYDNKKYDRMLKEKQECFNIDGYKYLFDIQVFPAFSFLYGCGYLDDVTAVYRIHDNSISSRGDINKRIHHRQRALRVRTHMAECLNMPQMYKDRINIFCGMDVLEAQLEARLYKDAEITNSKYIHSNWVKYMTAVFCLLRINNYRLIHKLFQVTKIRERMFNKIV